MFSLLFYTVNNLLLLFWAAIFCFRKPDKIKNIVFLMIAFSQLFLIMAFRNKIGYDFNMYAVGFRNMASVGFSNINYKDWEYGFTILTKIIGLIPGIDYDMYMVILSVIAIVPTAIFIYKNSKMPWVSTILYVNMFMYFMSMNFLRQMIAISILFLAWECMKKKRFILFALLIIAASFFHQTILIMLPVYFLVKMKPGIKELIMYGFILLWFYSASTNAIELVTSFYHEEYSESIFVKEGVSLIYAILPIIIVACAFILTKTKTIDLTSENKYLINLSLIGAIMMLTMSKHSIIERFSYYFIPFMILLVPLIYKSLKRRGVKYKFESGTVIDLTSKKSKMVISLCFLAGILLLSYLHFYFGLLENAHGVEKYQSWVKWFYAG